MFSGSRNRASPSSSSSSSSKSSLTTTSSSSPSPNPPPQTMEDVWNDISLASLHHQSSSSAAAAAGDHSSIILQDFLPLPSSPKDPPPTISSAAYPSPTPPPTALSLNSGPNFHFLANSDPLRPTFMPQSPPISSISSLDGSSSFDAFAPSGFFPFGKKKVPESGNNSSDRRHKRMIKNRESAARSRARKQECFFPLFTLFTHPQSLFLGLDCVPFGCNLQAYTNELEIEVANLVQENAKLKKQQQQQLLVATSAQFPKKNSLLRTFTAPF